MTRATLRVGLTGGVASGKSAVAARLAGLKVPILDADEVARELVEPGATALDEILAQFGEQLRMPDGRLDRRALRAIVFEDDAARLRLEAILHPRIRAALKARAEQVDAAYVVIAVPLLAEVGGYPWLDVVVVVDVARERQYARLLARDGIDGPLANRMLDAQATREARLSMADHVIDNSGSLADLDLAVQDLHLKLLAQAQMPRIAATPNAPSERT